MSTATAVDAAPMPMGNGKKKLILIIAIAAVLLLVVAGGGAFFLMKKKHASEGEADGETAAAAAKPARHERSGTPTFVPLDQFTVNLADRDAERYAQVSVTLELDDGKLADQIKSYMPAIRNNILLAIADKTAEELMDRDGKRRLAAEIRRETARALGYDVAGDGGRTQRKGADDALPVRAVHFSNFIIQ